MNRKVGTSNIVAFYIWSFFQLKLKQCFAVDPQFVACQPINCRHGPDISFPFYIQNLQESYCGFPGFGLNCSQQGFPVLQIVENEYIIEQIFYQNQTVQLQNTVFNRTSNGCISGIKNVTLDKRPFKFVSESRMYLLSKCDESLPETFLKYKIGCGEENRNDWGLAMFAEDESFESALQVCKNLVMVPVEMLGDERTNPVVDYQLLLKRGFRLNWIASNCTECLESGGRCGFDVTYYQFKCFCPDRPHSASCPPISSKRGKLIMVVAPVAAFSCIGILICLFYFRKKIWWSNYFSFWESKEEDHQNIEAFLKSHTSFAPKRYSYVEVKKITSCFRNKLGQGGFGYVYKGSLQDGSHVAVKILKKLKGSGEEFINEVASISRTSHVNIVSLVGFCFEGRKRALIYEFMPNGSLEKFIYDRKNIKDFQLGWPTLYKVAIGIARGLEYLHRGCNTRILHFDIKPQNILIDEDFCPKISDFGLSKLCNKKDSIVSMLGARGTIGYIAPEMVCRNFGGVSHKSDVYSYGMMVLEIVGGRKNVDVDVDHTSEIYFPHWIYSRLQLDDLGLAGILNEEEKECARKMVIVSLWCIQTDPSNRPPINRVLEMLEGNLDSLQIPPRPYLFSPSTSDVGSSVVEMA